MDGLLWTLSCQEHRLDGRSLLLLQVASQVLQVASHFILYDYHVDWNPLLFWFALHYLGLCLDARSDSASFGHPCRSRQGVAPSRKQCGQENYDFNHQMAIQAPRQLCRLNLPTIRLVLIPDISKPSSARGIFQDFKFREPRQFLCSQTGCPR